MGIAGLSFVITGGAVGIGAGTARLAASRGARVVVADLNDEAGEALVEEMRAAGGEAVYQHCDVTDESQVEALMAAAAATFGGIDVLHNNAGIHESMIASELSLESMSRATFEQVMGVNVTGVWLCAKYALPHLRQSDFKNTEFRAGHGHIAAFHVHAACKAGIYNRRTRIYQLGNHHAS